MIKKLKKYILLIIFYFIYFLINLLPNLINKYIGRALGIFFYHMKLRRKVAEENITRALGGQYSARELTDILKKYYQHLGQLLLEFFLMDNLRSRELREFVEITDKSILEDTYQEECGIVIYSAHLGNWEWLAAMLAQLGYPVTAIAKEQSLESFNFVLSMFRQKTGVKITDHRMGVRKAYQTLQKNELLYILGDQHAPGGVVLDFFGRPASVFRGAVHLASRTGAAILPVFLIRQDFASYRLEIEKPLWLPEDLSKSDEKRWLKKLVRLTEKKIVEHPEQWTWTHRRWKADQNK